MYMEFKLAIFSPNSTISSKIRNGSVVTRGSLNYHYIDVIVKCIIIRLILFMVTLVLLGCESKSSYKIKENLVDADIEKSFLKSMKFNAFVIFKYVNDQLVIVHTYGDESYVNGLIGRITNTGENLLGIDKLYKNEGKVEWMSIDATGNNKYGKGKFTISDTIPVINDVVQTSVAGYNENHEMKLSKLLRELDDCYNKSP